MARDHKAEYRARSGYLKAYRRAHKPQDAARARGRAQTWPWQRSRSYRRQCLE